MKGVYRKFEITIIALFITLVSVSCYGTAAAQEAGTAPILFKATSWPCGKGLEQPDDDLSLVLKKAADYRHAHVDSDITVELAAGTYCLRRPIVINSALTGSGRFEFRGAAKAVVRLVGWRDIGPPLTEVPTGAGAAYPSVARSHLRFYDLGAVGLSDYGAEVARGDPIPPATAEMEFFSGDRPLSPARWPAKGYARISKADSMTSFVLAKAPVAALVGRTDAWLAGFLGAVWRYQRIAVTDADPTTMTITVDRPSGYAPHADDFVALEGAPGLLSGPGMFHLERTTGLLAVWPRDGGDDHLTATVLDHAIEVDGGSNIVLKNLQILGTRGDGVVVRNGDAVQFVDSRVADTGRRGVVVEGGRDVVLSRLAISDTGDEGVWLSGGDRQTLEPARHRLENSRIERFARRTRSGRAAVWMDGVGNVAEGNRVADGPFNAFRFRGNDHLIRRNEISGILTDCGDCGAVYTWRDWSARGTRIEENVIRSIQAAPRRDVKGIYVDDLASGITVKRNFISGLMTGIFVGGGRDNLIEQNLIVGSVISGVLLDSRGTEWQAADVNNPTSEIRRNLSAVPFDRDPYRSRYRHLATILSDEPGKPKYNSIVDNVFLNGAGSTPESPNFDRSNTLSPNQLLPNQTVDHQAIDIAAHNLGIPIKSTLWRPPTAIGGHSSPSE